MTHGLWDELWAQYTLQSIRAVSAVQHEQRAVAGFLEAVGDRDAAHLVAASEYGVTIATGPVGTVRRVTLGLLGPDPRHPDRVVRAVERAVEAVAPGRYPTVVALVRPALSVRTQAIPGARADGARQGVRAANHDLSRAARGLVGRVCAALHLGKC
jgi:hypothetical protein